MTNEEFVEALFVAHWSRVRNPCSSQKYHRFLKARLKNGYINALVR